MQGRDERVLQLAHALALAENALKQCEAALFQCQDIAADSEDGLLRFCAGTPALRHAATAQGRDERVLQLEHALALAEEALEQRAATLVECQDMLAEMQGFSEAQRHRADREQAQAQARPLIPVPDTSQKPSGGCIYGPNLLTAESSSSTFIIACYFDDMQI